MSARWSRHAGVLFRHAADSVLLLPEGREEPIELRGTGVLVWEALERPQTLDDLAGDLAARYGVPASVVAADVRPTLQALQRLDAVRSEP